MTFDQIFLVRTAFDWISLHLWRFCFSGAFFSNPS